MDPGPASSRFSQDGHGTLLRSRPRTYDGSNRAILFVIPAAVVAFLVLAVPLAMSAYFSLTGWRILQPHTMRCSLMTPVGSRIRPTSSSYLKRSWQISRENVQLLGPKMRISPEHLPVLVAGDERDMFDREAGLEKAAGAFMPQVVEMQVFDLQLPAGASECRTD